MEFDGHSSSASFDNTLSPRTFVRRRPAVQCLFIASINEHRRPYTYSGILPPPAFSHTSSRRFYARRTPADHPLPVRDSPATWFACSAGTTPPRAVTQRDSPVTTDAPKLSGGLFVQACRNVTIMLPFDPVPDCCQGVDYESLEPCQVTFVESSEDCPALATSSALWRNRSSHVCRRGAAIKLPSSVAEAGNGAVADAFATTDGPVRLYAVADLFQDRTQSSLKNSRRRMR